MLHSNGVSTQVTPEFRQHDCSTDRSKLALCAARKLTPSNISRNSGQTPPNSGWSRTSAQVNP